MPYDPNNPFVDPRTHTASDLIMKVARQGLAGLQNAVSKEAQGIGVLKQGAEAFYDKYAPAPVKELVNYWNNTPDPIPGPVGVDNVIKGVGAGMAAAAPNMEKIWDKILGSKPLQEIFMPTKNKGATEDVLTHLPVEKALEIVGQYLDDPKAAANVIRATNEQLRRGDVTQTAIGLVDKINKDEKGGSVITQVAGDVLNPEQIKLQAEHAAEVATQLGEAGLGEVRDPYTKRALSQLSEITSVQSAKASAEGMTIARKAEQEQYLQQVLKAIEEKKPLPGKLKIINNEVAAPIGRGNTYEIAAEVRPKIKHLVPPGNDVKHFSRTTLDDITRRVTADKNLTPTDLIGRNKRFLNTVNAKEFESALNEISPEHADAIMRYVKGTNNFSTYVRNSPKASIQSLTVNEVEGLLSSVASKILEKNPTKKVRVQLSDVLKEK